MSQVASQDKPRDHRKKPASERRDSKITMGFTPEERDMLDTLSAEEDRPMTRIIVRSLREYYQNHHEQDIAD
ncbi:MAG: hypothetical protein LBL67_04365 [Coriobacteriales bacterium]|jgi:hypothetical protein|nr:hypothetical protein [Coriobacteriales bacterium]